MKYRGQTYYVVSINEKGHRTEHYAGPLRRYKGWKNAFPGSFIEPNPDRI